MSVQAMDNDMILIQIKYVATLILRCFVVGSIRARNLPSLYIMDPE